ncbi:hypothetical protein D3C85_1530840 [compost metagenome]
MLGDRRFRRAFVGQAQDGRAFFLSDRLAPLVLVLLLRLGDSFALAFEHHLPLELGNPPQHGQYQLAGWRAGVQPQIEDLDLNLLQLQSAQDLQQVGDRAGQPVELSDHEGIPYAGKFNGRFQLGTLSDGRHLLLKYLFTAAPF